MSFPVLNSQDDGAQKVLEQANERVRPSAEGKVWEYTDSTHNTLRFRVKEKLSAQQAKLFSGENSQKPTTLDSQQKLDDYEVTSGHPGDGVTAEAEKEPLAEESPVKKNEKKQKQEVFSQPGLVFLDPVKVGKYARPDITPEGRKLPEVLFSQPGLFLLDSVKIGKYSRPDITPEGRKFPKLPEVLKRLAPAENINEARKHLSIIMDQPCIPSLIATSVSRLNELKGAENAKLVTQHGTKDPNMYRVVLLLNDEVKDCLCIYDKRRVFTCNKEYCVEYLDSEKMAAEPGDMTAEQMVYNALCEAGNIHVFKEAKCKVPSKQAMLYAGLAAGSIGAATGSAIGGLLGCGLGFISHGGLCVIIGNDAHIFDKTTTLPVYRFEIKMS